MSFLYVGKVAMTGTNLYYPDNYLTRDTLDKILELAVQSIAKYNLGVDLSFD